MPRDNWNRDQTIVALRVYFSIPFNKASNSNQEIISNASIIGRSINSLKMKIGNFGSLDPELAKRGIVGLTGASRLDVEIWNEYANNKEKLALDSTEIIAKFKNKKVEELVEINDQDIPQGEDKIQLIKTRVNQQFFRDSILGIYDSKCCITGLGISKMLVASHIVPWSVDEKNRLNPENGLCLNALHDKAFDQGLITITTEYKVKLSSELYNHPNDDTMQRFFKEYENKQIILPERSLPNKDFLDFHFNTIFIK